MGVEVGEPGEAADEGEDGDGQGGWGGEEGHGEELREETSEATGSICGCAKGWCEV